MVAGARGRPRRPGPAPRRWPASTGRAAAQRLVHRAVAQLEHVAEHDEPVDAVERGEQRVGRRDGAGRRRRCGRPRCRSEITRVRTGRRRLLCRGRGRRPRCDGILVADLSRVLAGPLCTMTPRRPRRRRRQGRAAGRGDDTRAWGPPFVDEGATYYLGLNRNKRSVVARPQGPGRPRARARAVRARRRRRRVLPARARWTRLGPRLRRGRARPTRASSTARSAASARARRRARCPATTCCCRRWAA